jgi:hypothetical protein
MKPEGAAQRERNNMGKISYWVDVAESSHDRLAAAASGQKAPYRFVAHVNVDRSMSRLSA